MYTCFPRVKLLESGQVDKEKRDLVVSIRVVEKPLSSPLKVDAMVKTIEDNVIEILAWANDAGDNLYYRRAVGSAIGLLDFDELYKSERAIIELKLGSVSKHDLYQAILGAYHSLYFLGIRRNLSCKEVDVVINATPDEGNKQVIQLAEPVARGIYIAKDIANLPANILNPDTIVDILNNLYNYHNVNGLEINVIDDKLLEEKGFGGILSVGRASSKKPKLIEIVYRGNSEDPFSFLLVGKTVVFDSGGLDLKTREAMDEMKFDKSGGASVAGIMAAISLLKANKNVVGLMPVVENLPGPNAYKPRDVIKMYNGLRVEITNTDAEGRLILADALSYGVEKYKPKYVIDLATLTGSVVVALGNLAAGMFGTSEKLKELIADVTKYTGERVWELPLYEEYGDRLRSTIADLKNSGGKEGGASIAAWFLKQFVGNKEWVHLDIAGTAWVSDNDKARPPYRPGATGWGVETLSLLITNKFEKIFKN